MIKKGSISISRTTNGTYLMKVSDDVGDDVIEVEMSAVQFSSAITGKQSKCDLTVFTEN